MTSPDDAQARPKPPSVEHLATQLEGALADGGQSVPKATLRAVARRVITAQREQIQLDRGRSTDATGSHLVSEALAELERVAPLRSVVNATGVLLHTNLGRAPTTVSQAGDLPRGPGAGAYSDVEFDLRTGRRGRRFRGLEAALCDLTGAEAALVVNNNAAAVLLAMSALAAGREVVVSRGELIEIGGSFRIPEVISSGGALLREVGTTNKTHPADYRGALCERTAAVLSVHRSNFTIEGFTSSVSHRDLAEVASIASVPLVVDLGGGLVDTRCGWIEHGPPRWLTGEPGVRQVLAAGVDLVTFSGDKLFGGPQAGIVVGRVELVDRLRRHPLARALRLDRHRAELLADTTDAYLDGCAGDAIPLWRLANVPVAELMTRAREIVARVGDHHDLRPRAVEMEGTVGAGAAPGSAVPGAGIEVDVEDPDAFAAELRGAAEPVVSVVGDGAVRLHLRTVPAEADQFVLAALREALGSPESR